MCIYSKSKAELRVICEGKYAPNTRAEVIPNGRFMQVIFWNVILAEDALYVGTVQNRLNKVSKISVKQFISQPILQSESRCPIAVV